MIRRRTVVALLLGISLSLVACGTSESKKLQVAAASSLAGAFEALGKAYTAKTGTEVSLILSSSGKLQQQIREGAPYDVFASANLSYLKDLETSGDIAASSVRVYAEGRLALWTKGKEAPADLAALADKKYEHIAIANPEHAPYGTAAREALRSIGLWDSLESRVVRGSNVRQAMQYVESGNAEVALIAASWWGFVHIGSKRHAQATTTGHWHCREDQEDRRGTGIPRFLGFRRRRQNPPSLRASSPQLRILLTPRNPL